MMIRRRPQTSLSTTREWIGDNETGSNDKSTDKKSGSDRIRCRYLSSKLLMAVIVAAFILLAIDIANYLDSVSTIDPHHEPNNNIGITKSTTIGTIRTNGHETKETGRTISISDIPYVRHEPMAFKAIKAHFDYAASIGQAGDPNNANNTIGQYLLDFGIIGFPKCGTTTMMKWLNMHDNIAVLDFEITALQKSHPARILNYIIRDLPEGRFRRGYKSPTDLEDGRARNKLGVHYGKTKLLVGLRHPVLWYESFYNHRIQNGYEMPDLMEAIYTSKSNTSSSQIKNSCQSMWKGVCFPRANFHFALAKWGKTPLLFLPPMGDADGIDKRFNYANYNNQDEFSLFSKKDQLELIKDVNKTEISPNPIFLYDVNQLQMPPTSVDGSERDNEANDFYRDFVLSLQAFLGVPQNVSAMPPMIRESPGKKEGINVTEQLRRNSLKIDLCDDKYEIPRRWLIEIGSNIHLWIQNYFIKSPHNVFAGGSSGSASSSQFLAILQSYGKDPCPERLARKQQELLRQKQGAENVNIEDAH